jgi:hypothetical protein
MCTGEQEDVLDDEWGSIAGAQNTVEAPQAMHIAERSGDSEHTDQT